MANKIKKIKIQNIKKDLKLQKTLIEEIEKNTKLNEKHLQELEYKIIWSNKDIEALKKMGNDISENLQEWRYQLVKQCQKILIYLMKTKESLKIQVKLNIVNLLNIQLTIKSQEKSKVAVKPIDNKNLGLDNIKCVCKGKCISKKCICRKCQNKENFSAVLPNDEKN